MKMYALPCIECQRPTNPASESHRYMKCDDCLYVCPDCNDMKTKRYKCKKCGVVRRCRCKDFVSFNICTKCAAKCTKCEKLTDSYCRGCKLPYCDSCMNAFISRCNDCSYRNCVCGYDTKRSSRYLNLELTYCENCEGCEKCNRRVHKRNIIIRNDSVGGSFRLITDNSPTGVCERCYGGERNRCIVLLYCTLRRARVPKPLIYHIISMYMINFN